MSRHAWIATAIALVVASSLAVALPLASGGEDGEPQVLKLEDLEWMAGHWAGVQNGIQMEELWMPPKGGLMLGLHRDVFSEDRAFFEYLRIETRPEGPVYVASPNGRGATEFPLTSSSLGLAVFENLQHDFPQQIHYELKDKELHVRIAGNSNGESRSQGWIWKRVSAD